MAEVAVTGRFEDDRRQGETLGRPFVSALVVVGLTAAFVLLAWVVVVCNLASMATLWVVFAAIGAWAILRRQLTGRMTWAAFGSAQPEAPVVISHRTAPIGRDARRYRRFVPADCATTLHLQGGRQITARIVDMSVAAVAVSASLSEVDFLSVTHVGTHAAGPVRRTPHGAVFGFATLLDPQMVDASTML